MKIEIRIDLSADRKTLTYSFVKERESQLFTEIDGELIGSIENPDYPNRRTDLQPLERMDPELPKKYREMVENQRLSFEKGIREALFAAFGTVDVIGFSGDDADVMHYTGTFHR